MQTRTDRHEIKSEGKGGGEREGGVGKGRWERKGGGKREGGGERKGGGEREVGWGEGGGGREMGYISLSLQKQRGVDLHHPPQVVSPEGLFLPW